MACGMRLSRPANITSLGGVMNQPQRPTDPIVQQLIMPAKLWYPPAVSYTTKMSSPRYYILRVFTPTNECKLLGQGLSTAVPCRQVSQVSTRGVPLLLGKILYPNSTRIQGRCFDDEPLPCRHRCSHQVA